MICDSAERVDVRRLGRHLADETVVLGRLVRIERTRCHFGGTRTWFVCPDCDRRCAILYRGGCRVCLNGRYRSELKSPADRKLLKAIRTRALLGQVRGGVVVPFPEKPKGMHWRTYQAIRLKALAVENQILQDEVARLERRFGIILLPERVPPPADP